jgi:hypothetical protein
VRLRCAVGARERAGIRCDAWLTRRAPCADDAVARAKMRAHENKMYHKYGHSAFEMARARVKQAYHSLVFQYVVAGLILFAFVLDIVQAEVRASVPQRATPPSHPLPSQSQQASRNCARRMLCDTVQ